MRPDRLVVGEVRGAEVVDLLAALNTGHEGGFGTVHANAAADVPARVEALAVAAGLGREARTPSSPPGWERWSMSTVGLAACAGVAEIGVPDRSADGLVRVVTGMSLDGDRLRPGPGAALLEERLARAGPR